MQTELSSTPHRRQNLLSNEWVLVSPHRMKRPWQGQTEDLPPASRPAYDKDCYLCPGNARANDAVNPKYEDVHVFTNDFPALLQDGQPAKHMTSGLLVAESVRGTCRVIAYSPRHDLTLAEMDVAAIRRVIDMWARQTEELGKSYAWVQVFENKGAMMGCSNPHPHGQIWAMSSLPSEIRKEDDCQRSYYAEHNEPLLRVYEDIEKRAGERLVVEGDRWTAVVPYWATWPFEVLLMPRRHVIRFTALDDAERGDLAATLKSMPAAWLPSSPTTIHPVWSETGEARLTSIWAFRPDGKSTRARNASSAWPSGVAEDVQ